MPSYRIVPINTLRTINNKPASNMSCYAYARPARRYHSVAPFNFARASPFGDFAATMQPLFRMLDEELTQGALSRPLRTFQPRFDVREEGNAYLLQGELPGIDQRDISIEFKDEHTLVVSGRTARESQQGSEDKAKPAEDEAAPEDAADASSETGSSYHKPTVEDEFVDVASETQAAEATPATSAAEPAQEKAPEKAKDQSRYWVSERSVGQFSRTFTFAGHVDQEAVTASLSNGVLNIVVPKAAQKEPRKIQIE